MGLGGVFGLLEMVLRAFSIFLQMTTFVSLGLISSLRILAIRKSSGLPRLEHNFLPTRKFLVLTFPVRDTFFLVCTFLKVTGFLFAILRIFSHISLRVEARLPFTVVVRKLTTPIFRARSMSSFLGMRSHFLLFTFNTDT